MAHVGDSRAVLALRDGTVKQLTRDHTGKSLSPEERDDIKASGVAMVIGMYIVEFCVFLASCIYHIREYHACAPHVACAVKYDLCVHIAIGVSLKPHVDVLL